ncbi:MAG TPA: patatin-like phospholipase family protein [Longimicrobiales bacterium]|nr:patatin-like phospholipase family protein [Longimicrobiales bacterium]
MDRVSASGHVTPAPHPGEEGGATLPEAGGGMLGLVLTGGGARAAYQVGLLSWLARRYPTLRVPILTGVSAGAVNAVHLAAHHGTFEQAVMSLRALWSGLSVDHVFRVDTRSLVSQVGRWGLRLLSGGSRAVPQVQGLVDTSPLRATLTEALPVVDGEFTGIEYNLRRGALHAIGISTTSYGSGRSVAWIQGNASPWTRPQRIATPCRIGVDHVMASAALPLFFPAVKIGNDWYGDGGIRLAAPLSPALHLGAHRILAVSTRMQRPDGSFPRRDTRGYPPPAQVIGVLMNAIFLDLIDQDAYRLERLNGLIDRLPEDQRMGMRHIDLLVVRPSRDLGRLARAFEPRLPVLFRFLTRGLGTRESRSADMLSMLMFQQDYLSRLIELGEEDAEARADELAAFVEPVLARPQQTLAPASGPGA